MDRPLIEAEFREPKRQNNGLITSDRLSLDFLSQHDIHTFDQSTASEARPRGSSTFDDELLGRDRPIRRAGSNFPKLVHLATLMKIAAAAARDAVEKIAARRRVYSTGAGDLARNDPVIQAKVGKIVAAPERRAPSYWEPRPLSRRLGIDGGKMASPPTKP